MKALSLTKLRQHLYAVVDQVIETGQPTHILRKGHNLTLICEKQTSKLQRLKKHHAIVGDPEALVTLTPGSWSEPTIL